MSETVAIRRGETTRSEILQAAHDLFVTQGYHGTSMRQIAKRAGVALGGLYNHFKGKEDVFKAVFIEFHPYNEVLPVMIAAQGETVEDVIRDAIERMIAALRKRPYFMNLMFVEVVEFKSAHARELLALVLPQIKQIIQPLVIANRDRLRPIPPMMLLRAYFGMFFSYFLTEILFADSEFPELRENAVDHLLDIFLHGILKEEASSSLAKNG